MKNCPKCGCSYEGAEQFCPKDGSRLVSDSVMPPPPPEKKDPLIGQIIAERYKILDMIGEGGMGVVYMAEHVEIEKRVAVKVLRDDFSKRTEVVERFRQEAKAASRIGHPHIVDVTDFGQIKDGGVFFVMEHLRGEGLVDVMRRGPLPIERAARIIQQIARALNAAHKMGIVHRDLKPENIFLVEREDAPDFVKVLDFGIAKISDRDSEGKRLTKTGMIFGTPEYMSPEQAAGRSLDHRVDVYALGCIMFEMFTGSVPYTGDTFMSVLTQHMFEPVPKIEEVNPDSRIPEPLKNVVYRAMAKKVDERYSDMAELEAGLKRALQEAEVPVNFLLRSGPSTEISLIHSDVSGMQHVHQDGVETLFDIATSSTREQGKKNRSKIIALTVASAAALAVAVVVAVAAGLFDRSESKAVKVPASRAEINSEDEKNEEISASGKENDKNRVGDAHGGKRDEKINVTIETKPEGAVIFVENMGQVCSSSPCQVALESGSPVKIEARVQGRKSAMTFTPSDQNKKARLEIDKPEKKKRDARNGRDRSSSSESKKTKDDEKVEKKNPAEQSDGLKIPTEFYDKN